MGQKELPDKKKRILLSDTPLRPRASDDKKSVGAVGPDQFKLADRMSRLVEAIISPDTSTPFTVAITGDWGTGKTSSMGFLDEHIRYISSLRTCQTKFETCWIKPWKYQDREQVLKGLLYELIAATKPDPSVLKQLGAVILGTAAGGLSLISAKAIEKDKSEGSVSGKATGAVAEGRAVFDAINNPEARFSNVFEDAFKKLVTSKFKGNKRLIVFIDDLDRCLPEVALQVLEAIKLYLDISNIVFVIGVDRAIIDGIVIKHYCEALKPTAEERSAVVSKARSYLDKMFQVEFQAPPHEYEVRRFLASQLQELDLWNELKKEYKESFEPAISEVGQINPRAIVRAINTAVIGSGETLKEIQTLRVSGKEVPESLGLKLAQSVQMELIKAITSRLDERDFFPGVTEICRRELGVSFLKSWSNACFNNPGKARYLVDQQEIVLDRKPKFDVYVGSPRKSETGLTGKSESTQVDESHLNEIEETWAEFRSLMRHRAVGLCMGVPWPTDSPNDGGGGSDGPAPTAPFDLLIARIAEQRRTVPSQIDVEELKKETSLDLSNNLKVDDEVLIGISQFTNLASLALSGTSITDQGLKSIAKITALTSVDLSSTGITDEGLKILEKLTALTNLDLSFTSITDKGLKIFEKLTALTYLDLSFTSITGEGLKNLEKLSALTNLYLIHTKINDDGLKCLEKLTSLFSLNLSGTSITDQGLKRLEHLTGLFSLNLSGTRITDQGLVSLEKLTALTTLSLINTKITDEGLKSLEKLSVLTALYLIHTKVTDEGLKSLEKLSVLTCLYLEGTSITDEGLKSLEKLTALTILHLMDTSITNGGIKNLRNMLPNCEIVQ